SPQEVGLDKGYLSPLEYEGYDLAWNDEFEGSELNSRFWVYETGTGCPGNCGWGNNELQFYRANNAKVGDGVLTIEARKENYQNSLYTSARIKTQDLKTFKYGRVDIRALLPKGQGIWPALWMLGSNIRSVGWPSCGEIDIMEMIGGGGRENTIHGTLHWAGPGGEHQQAGGAKSLAKGTFADEYHVFSIIWDENTIRWYLNNQLFHTISITPEALSEFHQPFFFIFNVAVGGRWPGNPDSSTVFPQQMKVDYVRVFQKK
ncbi:MAG: glycoside hydrolase family 16 protein, partial [Bacteroidales bacterium]